jgi:hypothetical protein
VKRPEQQLQRAVVEHLSWRAAPGVFFFHVPNGGWRSRVEASIFKAMGVRAGIPDIIALRQGAAFAMELKAPGGRLSPTQIACHEAMRLAGATVETVSDIDTAIDLLLAWGIIGGGR